MFDEAALKAGGIAAEDRHGNPSFFPLTTLTIGAVRIVPDAFSRAEDVASAAALAKRHAKHGGGGLWLLDGGRTMPLPVPAPSQVLSPAPSALPPAFAAAGG